MKHKRPAATSAVKDSIRQRCALTGVEALPEELLSFVCAPDGRVVCDIKHNLPVRERLWLVPRREAVNRAAEQGLFAALADTAYMPEDLAGEVERLLLQRLVETLSLLRRSGALVSGFEKVRSGLGAGDALVLVQASDASEDGRKKLAKLAGYNEIPVIDNVFSRDILAAITGSANQVHMLVLDGGLGRRFMEGCDRFAAYNA